MASHAAAATEQSVPKVRNENPRSKPHKAKAIPVLIAGTLAIAVCFIVRLMLVCVVPIRLIAHATECRRYLVLGLFVGAAGSLGGFLLPIVSGALPDLTGIRTSRFTLMYGVVRVSPLRMYWTEVRQAEVIGPRSKAFGLKG